MSPDCPSQTELRDFHFGNLSEREQDAIANHLESCQLCEQHLQSLDTASDDTVEAVRKNEDSISSPHHNSSRPILAPGLKIEDYEVMEEIGHGGMGIVCKAQCARLKRTVALKLLVVGELSEYRMRFQSEAEATARLRHPNIVQIYEVGTWKRNDGLGIPFLALEYLGGGNLSEHTQGRPQPSSLAISWIETLARAVQHAHDHGVVHRDIKPSNILLDVNGQLKLCDFGVAKLLEGSGTHTRTGMLVGTPEYMAPEQTGEGQPIGVAADIWALGALLYALLTGGPPFTDADYLQVLQKVRRDDPVSPRQLQPSISRDLETVCLKCLQKDPQRRYLTASELADDLERIRDGRSICARPVSLTEQSWKWFRRHPTLASTLAWFILMATVGLPFVTWLWLRSESALHQADEHLERAESALYFNQIALARQGMETEGIDQTLLMLERCRPKNGAPDYRNWEWRYLNHQSKLGYREGLNHLSEGKIWTWLYSIDWSQDGKHLVCVGGPVSGKLPGHFRIWNTDTWKCESHSTYSGGTLFTAIWHPKLPHLFTGGADGKLMEWDVASNSPLRTLWQTPGKVNSVRQLKISSDGKLLAIGSTEGLYLYDLETEHVQLVAEAEWPGVISLDFREEFESTDSRKTLLLASFRGKATAGQVQLWDVTDPVAPQLRNLSLPDELMTCAGFTKEGRLAISPFGTNDVAFWDEQGKLFHDRLGGHRGGLIDLEIGPNDIMATAGEDGTVRLWNLASRTELAVLRGHTEGVRKIAFSPDGSKLASCGEDLRICVWDVGQDPRAVSLQAIEDGGGEFAGGIAFSKDSKEMVVVSQFEKSISRFDVTNGHKSATQEFPLIQSYGNRRRDQALRNDGSQLASPDPVRTHVINIWNVMDGSLAMSLDEHESKPEAIEWSGNGRVLATAVVVETDGKFNSRIRVWDMRTGRMQNEWYMEGERLFGLAVNSTGTLVAASLEKSQGKKHEESSELIPSDVCVWDTLQGRMVHRLPGGVGLMPGLSFRPDSQQIAAIGPESLSVYTWDLNKSKKFIARQMTVTPTSIIYSPDGNRIATGCYDNRIRLWDSHSANEAITLQCLGKPGTGHYGFKSWIAFSSDGRRLAATNWQGAVTIWDAPFSN